MQDTENTLCFTQISSYPETEPVKPQSALTVTLKWMKKSPQNADVCFNIMDGVL